MAEQPRIEARPRDLFGKKVRRLRREGIVPAVIYGPVIDGTIPVSVDALDFEKLYRSVGTTSLVDVAVNGATHTVFIREVQTHPVRREILHIDFYAPNLRMPINAMVPVITVGELSTEEDSMLAVARSEVEVRALPGNIPPSIEVDIAGLRRIDDAIHVSDVTPPAGVEILTPPDELLVKLSPPAREEEEAAEPEKMISEEAADTARASLERAGKAEDAEE